MAKVAFIGLGVMGYPMAGHLRKKGGHDVTVYNRTTARAEQWVGEFGGAAAETTRPSTPPPQRARDKGWRNSAGRWRKPRRRPQQARTSCSPASAMTTTCAP